VKLGGEASVAAGPIGAGANADITADLIAFSRSKGVYGGLNLNGTVVAVADNWNQAYYGRTVTPPDILMTAGRTIRTRTNWPMQSAARPAAPRQVCVDASHAPAITAAQVTEAARSFGFEPLCLDSGAGELARPGRQRAVAR
jgi:hypothetical protein